MDARHNGYAYFIAFWLYRQLDGDFMPFILTVDYCSKLVIMAARQSLDA